MVLLADLKGQDSPYQGKANNQLSVFPALA